MYFLRFSIFFCYKIQKNHWTFENSAQEVNDFHSWNFQLEIIRDHFPRDHPHPRKVLSQIFAKLFFSFSNRIFLALDLNAISIGLRSGCCELSFRNKEWLNKIVYVTFFTQILLKKIHCGSILPLWLQIKDFSLWVSFQLLFKNFLHWYYPFNSYQKRCSRWDCFVM